MSSKWQGFGKGLFGGSGFFFVKTQLKDDPGLLAAFPEPAGPPAPGTRPLGPLGRVYFNSFGAIKVRTPRRATDVEESSRRTTYLLNARFAGGVPGRVPAVQRRPRVLGRV